MRGRRLSAVHAAVDGQHLAGDVGGLVADQIQCRICNLLWLAQPAQHGHGGEPVQKILKVQDAISYIESKQG